MMTEATWTFKEMDSLLGRPKGAAFRAFKALGERLKEGEDFYWLDATAHAAEIDALRRSGRIYASTINAVLLTATGRRQIEDAVGRVRRQP